MNQSRRGFLRAMGVTSAATVLSRRSAVAEGMRTGDIARRFQFVQIDVFTSRRLQGNPLAVFPDARGLSDLEMQDLARETNLQETTFVFPRERAIEQEKGVQVRIFIPTEEVPFGGHPTLGTAMVLRNRRLADGRTGANQPEDLSEISLDLRVGKIPVSFRDDGTGNPFGEMHQVDPVFGPVHEPATIAALLDLKPSDLVADWPIQTISTGLQFAIVPIRQLNTLRTLNPDLRKVYTYLDRQNPKCDFYYVTRDTQDPEVGLRSRAIYPTGEDAATGSAAGCTASWMVRYGIVPSGTTVHIQQGVEMQRPSQIFVRADKRGEKIANVRVGGHAVEITQGEVTL